MLANRLQDVERKSLTTAFFYGKQEDDWYVARAVQHLGSKLDIKEVTKTSMIR